MTDRTTTRDLNDAVQNSQARQPRDFRADQAFLDGLGAESIHEDANFPKAQLPITHWFTGWTGMVYEDETAQSLLDKVITDGYWESEMPDPKNGDIIAGYDQDNVLIQMRVVCPLDVGDEQQTIG